jgi:hypothetical protein
MTPVLLENSRPFVERADRIRVGAVEHLATVAAKAHETDMPKHLEVLRHRRLTEIEVLDDVADVTFLRREVDEDVAALSFGDRVEDVGCRRSAGHSRELYSHYGICQLPRYGICQLPRGQALVTPSTGVRPRVRDDSTYAVYEMLRA